MHNVDFGYVPEKQVLYDVTLYAKPGQKIAFVGATGAGKTTITRLGVRYHACLFLSGLGTNLSQLLPAR